MTLAGFPVLTDSSLPRGMVYLMSAWKNSGMVTTVYCHPEALPLFMEQRWTEGIAAASAEVARSLWLGMGRRERDRRSLEHARAGARRREWRV